VSLKVVRGAWGIDGQTLTDRGEHNLKCMPGT